MTDIRGFIRAFLQRRSIIRPMLYDFGDFNYASTDPSDLIQRFCPSTGMDALEKVKSEFNMVREDISGKLQESKEKRKWEGSVDWATSFLLYALVRLEQPESVVETGISRGVSTVSILSAMDRNGKGILHSFDVIPDAGYLVGGGHPRWKFAALDPGNARKGFSEIVSRLKPLDIFFHDSDHSYGHQLFEYETAFSVLGKGGLLISDDVNFSFAFLDFSKNKGMEPGFLVTVKNVVGLARV